VKFSIRPATVDDAAGIAAVHVQSWRSSYAGIVPQAHLDSLDVDARTKSWTKLLAPSESPHFHAVAVDEGERIVGFVDAGKNRDAPVEFRGELFAIYLLDEAKGTGAGNALFDAAASWLRENELAPFLLWVLKDNARARRFYAKAGGVVAGEKPHPVGGKPLVAVAYGWRSDS
jgi:ribosomal protein S18 acetylase RimI-like enzyme